MKKGKNAGYGWESELDKIKICLKASAKNKLKWLQEVNEFTYSAISLEQKKLRIKLRYGSNYDCRN